ncbi:MAG: alpha/beta fold hydrolase [Salibacteraceae bacterium]
MKYLVGLVVLILFSACNKFESMDAPGNLVPKTVTEDPSLPRVSINGTILHSQAFGKPNHPLLVVLHGGPGADYRSLLQYQELAKDGYYVVFFDQRGSGLSERVAVESITQKNYLEDLNQIIQYYTLSDTQEVYILGHSWGAMYATMFINEYPNRISKAIFVEPGGFTSDEISDFFQKTFQPELFSEWMNDMAWVNNGYSSDSHEKVDYKRAMLVANVSGHQMDSEDNPAPIWRWGGMTSIHLPQDQKEFDWTTNLAAFKNEVLFINSELNTVQTLAHQKGLAAHYPNSQVITVANVGHDVLYQRFEECRSIILNFLN